MEEVAGNNEKNEIYFNFSYSALNLLGKNLYSNHWTAISELVANGVDAQADDIKIYINMSNKKKSVIEIIDNGHGMNYEDLLNKYAFIGRDKREDSLLSPDYKSKQMGRKGIGKLAALYLSECFFLVSKTSQNTSAWCLDATEVSGSDRPKLERVKEEEIQIECLNEWQKNNTGTLVKLTDVDMTNFGVQTIEGLKARMADFYLLDKMECKISIAYLTQIKRKAQFEEIEKSIAFKNFYAFFDTTSSLYSKYLSKNVIYLTPIKEVSDKARAVVLLDNKNFSISGMSKFVNKDGVLSENEYPYELKGWIGIHTSIKKENAELNDPEFLKNKAYTPNQLRLYVRKKLAVEDFLKYLNNNQAMINYIEGEITFDILDHDDLPDIATSSRQGFVETDQRVQLLINILKPIINNLINERLKLGKQVKDEQTEIIEREKQELENKRKQEEQRKIEAENKKYEAQKAQAEAEQREKKAEERSNELENELEVAEIELGSEKKRNTFLHASLSGDQLYFSQRIHMLKINLNTIENKLSTLISKSNRGKLDEKDIRSGLEVISYNTNRMKSLLEYSAYAKFDLENEKVLGDLFGFYQEYISNVLKPREDTVKVTCENPNNSEFEVFFSPQDLTIIIENIVSNSQKNKARNLVVKLEKKESKHLITFTDDGDGLTSQAKKNVEELFLFGKSYTRPGTGVGLHHIKKIADSMKAEVSINKEISSGFELELKFK